MFDRNKIFLILLFISCLFIYTRGLALHGVEYRDDEIFYYKASEEMLQEHNYFSPTYLGEDRFQKPILFYWLIMLSYKIFGINWFAARFVAVLFAGMTVCLTWKIAFEFFNRRVAFLSAAILMAIPLFFRHAKNAVPDMSLNFFTVLGMWAAIQFFKNPNDRRWHYLLFLSAALGFMIKGFAPMIIVFLTMTIYAFFTRQADRLRRINFSYGIFLMLAIILPWFLYMIRIHGADYLDYMFTQETQNRLIDRSQGNFVINTLHSFLTNTVFYLEVLLNYFAPWCIFFAMALPWTISNFYRREERLPGLQWMVIWFLVVFLFFSLVHVTINHYLLVLSTPFAILVAYFLMEMVPKSKTLFNIVRALLSFFFVMGFLGWTFLHIFLAKANLLWLPLDVLILVTLIIIIWRKPRPMTAPIILAVLILFVCSQTKVMIKAGVTAHATLSQFAQTINEDEERHTIGVGSHDIHEKEFQVFFDQRVEKIANSETESTLENMREFFESPRKIYYLMTEKDYAQFHDALSEYPVDVVQEEYIFRKRLHLDRGFIAALLRLDQDKIHDYLMEKLILLRKAPYA
ncbi:MAG: glycosyltransferase family 39 protein [Candidatus Omnitrophica bacterium]|nr:glycosyltransferase family 39 protein [Candidatus Omnitrophota bacterium]